MLCKIIPKKYLFWSLCAFCLSLFFSAFLPSSSVNALRQVGDNTVYINYSDLPITLNILDHTTSGTGIDIYFEPDDDNFLGKTIHSEFSFSNLSGLVYYTDYYSVSVDNSTTSANISYPNTLRHYNSPFIGRSIVFPESRSDYAIIPQSIYLRIVNYTSDGATATITISEVDNSCPLCPVIPTNPYDQKLDNIYHAILYCGASLLVICIYLSIYKIYQRVRRR